MVAVGAVIVLGATFVIGAAVGRFSYGVRDGRVFAGPKSALIDSGQVRTFHAGLLNNQNRLEGVVTAVNGTSFTLAGNGATNTIDTNSSTQWQGGDSVKTNDTVIATGTTSNNTFTATEIVINP